MRKLGMPDGVIQHKLMMDGVTLDILRFEIALLALSLMDFDEHGLTILTCVHILLLRSCSMDPEGPSPNAGAGAGELSNGPPALPPPPQGLPPPPAGRPALPPPPVAKYDGSDDDFDSDSD